MVNLCCLCCGEIPRPRPPQSTQSGPPRDPRFPIMQQLGSGPGALGRKGEQEEAKREKLNPKQANKRE
ncbi:unnamed protein product [Lota lota]